MTQPATMEWVRVCFDAAAEDCGSPTRWDTASPPAKSAAVLMAAINDAAVWPRDRDPQALAAAAMDATYRLSLAAQGWTYDTDKEPFEMTPHERAFVALANHMLRSS